MLVRAPLLHLARIRYQQRSSPPGCLFYHAVCVPHMGGVKDGSTSVDRHMKRKVVVPVWRPISMQSGASAAGIAVSLSSSSADYDSQSKATTGEQATFSSSEVENLSKRQEHTAISGSHQQEEVMEENMHNYSSNKDVELVSGVEKHSVSVEVDASLVRFIKGKGGSTQKQIEGETGVKITLPSSKNGNYIVIEGNTEESVTKASGKIASVLEQELG